MPCVCGMPLLQPLWVRRVEKLGRTPTEKSASFGRQGGELEFDEMVDGLLKCRGPVSKTDIISIRLKTVPWLCDWKPTSVDQSACCLEVGDDMG